MRSRFQTMHWGEGGLGAYNSPPPPTLDFPAIRQKEKEVRKELVLYFHACNEELLHATSPPAIQNFPAAAFKANLPALRYPLCACCVPRKIPIRDWLPGTKNYKLRQKRRCHSNTSCMHAVSKINSLEIRTQTTLAMHTYSNTMACKQPPPPSYFWPLLEQPEATATAAAAAAAAVWGVVDCEKKGGRDRILWNALEPGLDTVFSRSTLSPFPKRLLEKKGCEGVCAWSNIGFFY